MSENPGPQDQPYPPQQPYNPPQYQQSSAPQYAQGQYPQGPYVPRQYGTGYPAGRPLREHPQATLAFVLGLLSVLGLTVLGPFGWYYGRKVIREIDTDPRSYTNRGLAMAGMVLGIIGTVFLILVAVFVVFAVVAVIVGASRSGGSGSGGLGASAAVYWL